MMRTMKTDQMLGCAGLFVTSLERKSEGTVSHNAGHLIAGCVLLTPLNPLVIICGHSQSAFCRPTANYMWSFSTHLSMIAT